MKARLIVVAVVALMASGLLLSERAVAEGACHEVTSTVLRNGIARSVVTIVCPGSTSGSAGSATPLSPEQIKWSQNQVINCLAEAGDIGLDPTSFCGEGGTAPPTVTPSFVMRALAQQRIPPAQLRIQPPNGRTLVNFDTNFFTDRPAFTRVVTLLGQRITLRIEPTAFTWHFGTGESRTTSTPGAPYPRLLVTHDYEKKGRFSPRVDTTYGATFRVGGGPWRPVPGTVTITGPTVALEAVEARPVLTAP